MAETYYLCFSINKLPDLTLTKYSVYDGSSVDNIMNKHGVFLRQLHRLGYKSGVYFHLLYYYNADPNVGKGHHLAILFYATAKKREKLEGIREFLISSVLSTYYDFYCYEVSTDFSLEQRGDTDVLVLKNIAGQTKEYALGKGVDRKEVIETNKIIKESEGKYVPCEVASDADVILKFSNLPVDCNGRIVATKVDKSGQRQIVSFSDCAFLTKKDYMLPAQNRFESDGSGEVPLYSIMEWEPCEKGRLYNVLKLMEGYNRNAVLRIDIFPVEHTQEIRRKLPYSDTRRRTSDRAQGRDDNSENIIRSWDKYLNNLMKFPQFVANVVGFADSQDIAVMLVDSVAAEAVESGTYSIESLSAQETEFDMYYSDTKMLYAKKDPSNYVAPFLSLYTLEEIRPMFSFPILYPGETVECQKETDPKPISSQLSLDKENRIIHEAISLGRSATGYPVNFPVKLFSKHAFIAGVPGSGKTNTMLHLVTSLWKDTKQQVPFLVLEPAKQEYRSLAKIPGMEKLCIFSPGADTKFPLHINPFQFPIGLTLAEHIANLNAVFAGAFELIPPTPFLIDTCIEKIYLEKGWNINERNRGIREYPTMQELYDSLEIAVEESGYEGESKSNIRSVLEVRIGSLLRREIGNVYNVKKSIIEPEEWLSNPIIIELEALGEGPANFMSLLISTLIREVLKVKKSSKLPAEGMLNYKGEIEHIIFYEEAHNLIGPTTDSPVGGAVDPKISATKYIVKMLAEVRALNEGIVIADQLPTAMAPEILKNTGLKLAHRITAQDDRSLLGGTMSATADQLEEQGTYGTGEALIFYEGLLRPYKMRVSEWEKEIGKSKYDALSNEDLFELLKYNDRYLRLLNQSAEIMITKMHTEYMHLKDKAQTIMDSFNKINAQISLSTKDEKSLKIKLQQITKETSSNEDEIKVLEQNIQQICNKKQKNMLELNGSIIRKITKLCWEFTNLYYSYRTLSENYYQYNEEECKEISEKIEIKNSMKVANINEYLQLFKYLKDVIVKHTHLRNTIIQNTRDVMLDIQKQLDFKGNASKKNIMEQEGINTAYLYYRHYFSFEVSKEKDDLMDRLETIFSYNNFCTDEDRLEDLRQETRIFSENATSYLEYSQNLSERMYHATQELKQKKEKGDYSDIYLYGIYEELETSLEDKEYIDKLIDDQILSYGRYALDGYEITTRYINLFFQALREAGSDKKRVVYDETKDIRGKYLEIVNYIDGNKKTILSNLSSYADIRTGAKRIPEMEITVLYNGINNNLKSELKRYGETTFRNDAVEFLCKVLNSILITYQPTAEVFECKYALCRGYIDYLNIIMETDKNFIDELLPQYKKQLNIFNDMLRSVVEDDRLSENDRRKLGEFRVPSY